MHVFESDAERCSFRSEVMEAARCRPSPAEPGQAWRDLSEGRSSVLDTFGTASHSFLVTTRDLPHPPLPLRSSHVLERVVTGSYPKLVASDLRLATSTIAFTLKQALAALGVSCSPSKVPCGLVALIHGARTPGAQLVLTRSFVRLLGFECEVLTTPMPSLAHLLPPVVEEVLGLHVAGKSHREIAALRGTSCRTVANQLATAFERIGSSGRLGVLEILLSRGQQVRPLAARSATRGVRASLPSTRRSQHQLAQVAQARAEL